MTEDPLLRRLHDALSDVLGEPRVGSVADSFVAPRDGIAKPNDAYQFFINDVAVNEPTPYRKGDKIRAEFKQ